MCFTNLRTLGVKGLKKPGSQLKFVSIKVSAEEFARNHYFPKPWFPENGFPFILQVAVSLGIISKHFQEVMRFCYINGFQATFTSYVQYNTSHFSKEEC